MKDLKKWKGKVSILVKASILTTFLALALQTSRAQDIHFSQFYFSPLSINPAATGFFHGKYRFAANYRDQWRFVPYLKTYATSFDVRIVNNVFGFGNFFAGGVHMYGDQPEPGHIGRTGFAGSSAFHLSLDGRNHYISFGLQSGVQQIGFDPNLLVFGDQIVGGTQTSMESFAQVSTQFTDLNMGFLWNLIPSEYANMYAGLSFHHINKPEVRFNNLTPAGSSFLAPRVIFHAGGAFALGDEFDIIPAVLFMKQKASTELTLGSALRFNMDDDAGFRFGTWMRMGTNFDALVFMTAVDWQRFILGLSYDANISSLRSVSKARGGFELALIYKGGVIIDSKRNKRRGRLPCPVL